MQVYIDLNMLIVQWTLSEKDFGAQNYALFACSLLLPGTCPITQIQLGHVFVFYEYFGKV